MNAMTWFRTAAITAALVTASAAQATPTLLVTNGYLTGAHNVDVGGSLYDVRFESGSCISLFNGCISSDFAFNTSVSAQQAAMALSTVFVNGPAGNFDTDLSKIVGCGNLACVFLVPYDVIFGNLFVAYYDHFAFARDVTGIDTFGAGTDTASVSDDVVGFSYAAFSAAAADAPVTDAGPSGVPEPASVALFGIGGIAAYGAARRRRTA